MDPKHPSGVTIFKAEVYVIWSYTNHIKGLNHKGKCIYICSNSRPALNALAKTFRIAAANSVKLIWIPSIMRRWISLPIVLLVTANRYPHPITSLKVSFIRNLTRFLSSTQQFYG